ncbi:hypothetical protein HDU86_001842 [Geranomyces michiganensis]|nr:hypothetical protein HDU86_001842 [Geranomyces michiganensis]
MPQQPMFQYQQLQNGGNGNSRHHTVPPIGSSIPVSDAFPAPAKPLRAGNSHKHSQSSLAAHSAHLRQYTPPPPLDHEPHHQSLSNSFNPANLAIPGGRLRNNNRAPGISAPDPLFSGLHRAQQLRGADPVSLYSHRPAGATQQLHNNTASMHLHHQHLGDNRSLQQMLRGDAAAAALAAQSSSHLLLHSASARQLQQQFNASSQHWLGASSIRSGGPTRQPAAGGADRGSATNNKHHHNHHGGGAGGGGTGGAAFSSSSSLPGGGRSERRKSGGAGALMSSNTTSGSLPSPGSLIPSMSAKRAKRAGGNPSPVGLGTRR